jgi:hypothetical protein
MITLGNLVDSPTQRIGESIFDYEYLRKFEAKIFFKFKDGVFHYIRTQFPPPPSL